MAARLKDYASVVGTDVLQELEVLAEKVEGWSVQHINSTAVGGGVAEMLQRLNPLMKDLGIDSTWDQIEGNTRFFRVTKAIHNALHGSAVEITPGMFDDYRDHLRSQLDRMTIRGDTVFIHDPQPAGLIALKERCGGAWIWRCHIDISTPDRQVWDFLQPYVNNYDAAIFSMPDFSQELNIPQFLVPPSIDPLGDKNRELDPGVITGILEKHGIDPNRPIITQISRFDHLKDPLGVIRAYQLVRKRTDCQLVLAGGEADDDPEGPALLKEVQEKAAADPDIHVLLLPPFSDLEINALVRGSSVVVQKSIKEGFGLTVAEALWKRKPVIGGAVGGIRRQILHGVTGFLVRSVEGTAYRIRQILNDDALARQLGENGRVHVQNNFLLTRHLKDYILLMLALRHPGQDMIPV
ncbi:MAG: glycosyltransferase [Acidobacteria bacterium]|nr:glycosyltransferase [Acidobacteriota bacterium]